MSKDVWLEKRTKKLGKLVEFLIRYLVIMTGPILVLFALINKRGW